MTEQHQEDRLNQLMHEFMGTTAIENPAAPTESAPPSDIRNEELYERYEFQNEQIDALRTQMQELQSEIIIQRESNLHDKNAQEIAALQKMYSTHAAKIEDLEYEQEIIKADVGTQADKKPAGFGNWGWVFLVSNVMLWSMLGWFLWERYASDGIGNGDGERTMVTNEQYNGLDEVTNNEYEGAMDTAAIIHSDLVVDEKTPFVVNYNFPISNLSSTSTTPKTKGPTQTRSTTFSTNHLTENDNNTEPQRSPGQKVYQNISPTAESKNERVSTAANQAVVVNESAPKFKKESAKKTTATTTTNISQPEQSEEPPIRFGD